MLGKWWLMFSGAGKAPIGGGQEPEPPVQDTQPPTAPGTPTFSQITSTSFRADVSPATDNVGVVSYDWYVNGAFLTTTASPFVVVSGRAASTQYSVAARATDAAGNNGPQGTAASVTTAAAGSVIAVVSSENEITLEFPYAVQARNYHSSFVWTTNYGFTITDGDIAYRIKNISALGNFLVLTVAGVIEPGRTVNISFAPDAYDEYPFSTSPLRAGSLTAIDSFSAAPTRGGSFTGTVRYVSAGASGAGNGQSESTPWTLSQLLSSGLNSNTTILFRRGDTFTLAAPMELNRLTNVRMSTYGTGNMPIITTNSTASPFTTISLRWTHNITIVGLSVRHTQPSTYQGIRAWSQNTATTDTDRLGSLYVYNCFARAGNGIYARDEFRQTSEIVIEGCTLKGNTTGNACEYIEGEYANGIRNTYNYWNDYDPDLMGGGTNGDALVLHAVLNDGGGGNDGDLGPNHIISGCYFHNMIANGEALLDLTSPQDCTVRNCFFDNDRPSAVDGGRFIEDGWNGKKITIEDNYFRSPVGSVWLSAHISIRTADSVIRNNVFRGTARYSVPGNFRAIISYYSAQNGEFATNAYVGGNTFILEQNAASGGGSEEYAIGFWNFAGSPELGDFTVENNVFIKRRAASNGFYHVHNGNGTWNWSKVTARNNKYYQPSGSNMAWLDPGTVNFIGWQGAGYSKDLASEHSNLSGVYGLAENGEFIYYARLINGNIAGDGVANALLTDDIEGTARTNPPTPGAFNTVFAS